MEWLNRKGCWLRGPPPPARRGASRGENLLLEIAPPPPPSPPFPRLMCAFVYAGGESGEKNLAFLRWFAPGAFCLLYYFTRRRDFNFKPLWSLPISLGNLCPTTFFRSSDKRELRREKGGETVSSFRHGRTKTTSKPKPEAANLLFSAMCWIDNCSFFSPSIPPPFHAMFFHRGEMAGPSRIALCYRSWPATASFGGNREISEISQIETTPDKKRLGLPN